MAGDLLAPDGADQLISTARTAIGDSLRSITFFTRDDFQQVYLRDDLEKDADLDSFIGHEWHDFGTTQNAYRSSELGDYEYTLRSFENGYLLRITTDRRGIFVTTDWVTLRDFEEVATALKDLLVDWEANR